MQSTQSALPKRNARPAGASLTGPFAGTAVDRLYDVLVHALDDGKAEDIVTIDLRGKSSIADFMLIASGRSQRQVVGIADRIVRDLKDAGFGTAKVEGMSGGDWVLIDAGDAVVHLFRPEVRNFYNLEKMWAVNLDDGASKA